MPKNLKSRLEDLMNRTGSKNVLEGCKSALEMHKMMSTFNMSKEAEEKMEVVIVEDLINSLNGEEAVLEFSDIAIKNLGVKKGIEELKADSTIKNMPLFYVLEKMNSLINQPEWLVYEQFVNALTPFDFEVPVKFVLNRVKTNANRYAEDIKIQKAVYEVKNSRNSFLMPALQNHIDDYIVHKTPSNRSVLIEKLSKYSFEPSIRNLHNTILEGSQGFEIKATSNDAFVKKVFSPVIVTKDSETFVIHEKAYKKVKNQVTPLTENEISYLPDNFVKIANFINQPNVSIEDNTMKIFYKDKKVIIKESSSGELSISFNNKTTNPQDFGKVYLASGLYNSAEMDLLKTIQNVLENWNSICEIDIVKSIYSKAYPNRRADVFKCENTMHINTVDSIMNENLFYENCTIHQSINHIREFVNYDLTLTFNDLMSPEKKQIAAIEERRNEYAEAISYLEKRRNLLESQDEYLINTPEVKALIEAISLEIESLKKRYFNDQAMLISINQMSEGVGVNVGDAAELVKKK